MGILGIFIGFFVFLAGVLLFRWARRTTTSAISGPLPLDSPQIGWRIRFNDAVAGILWPFPPPARVRLAFPCPACYQPLLGKVAPGEELICPWCRTSFQTPEPPPAAPPVPRKTRVKRETSGRGFWSYIGFVSFVVGLAFTFGLIFIAAILLYPRYPWQALLMMGILVLIWSIAWLVQAVMRRVWSKGNFLPPSFFGEGGGTVLGREIYRTLVTLGLPFVGMFLGGLIVGCLGVLMGILFGLSGGM